MWRIIAQLVVGGLIAAQALGTPAAARAGDTPPAAKSAKQVKKAKRAPFHGTLKAVDDKVAMTITVAGKTADRTFQITSQTRLFKAGKPATLSDTVVGDAVNVSGRETADGKWEAISVRFGAKPEGAKKPKKQKTPAPEPKAVTK